MVSIIGLIFSLHLIEFINRLPILEIYSYLTKSSNYYGKSNVRVHQNDTQ